MDTRTDRVDRTLSDEEVRKLPHVKFKAQRKVILPIAPPKMHAGHDHVFCWCWISEWSKWE